MADQPLTPQPAPPWAQLADLLRELLDRAGPDPAGKFGVDTGTVSVNTPIDLLDLMDSDQPARRVCVTNLGTDPFTVMLETPGKQQVTYTFPVGLPPRFLDHYAVKALVIPTSGQSADYELAAYAT